MDVERGVKDKGSKVERERERERERVKRDSQSHGTVLQRTTEKRAVPDR